MMVTEKYYSLPPLTSSSSTCTYSTICQKDRYDKVKLQQNLPKKLTIFNQLNPMKFSTLHNVQQPIDFDSKEKISFHSSSSSDTLQSVLVNSLHQTIDKNESYGSTLSRTMMNSTSTNKRRTLSSSQIISLNDQKRSQRYCSLLSTRIRTYSLSNHLTMAITATTSFSEDQTSEPQEMTSVEYENTYFCPEETTRLDEIFSLTTITSNLQQKQVNSQLDLSAYSDTTISQSDVEENFEGSVKQYGDTYEFDMGNEFSNDNLNVNNNNNNQIIQIRLCLTPPDQESFTGVVHAKKCTIIKDKECLSDYDNVKHYYDDDDKMTMIRSNVDNASLNQLINNDQQIKRTNNPKDDNYMKRNRQAFVQHSIQMKQQIDDEQDSDVSHCSDDLRYSSDTARHSCASDDLNNTSSTLRQEAISITKVRCKRRKTWIRSPNRSPTLTKSSNSHPQHRLKTNRIQPFLSSNQVTGTNASVNSTTIRNQTRVKPLISTMLLHNNSLNCNNNNNNNNHHSKDQNGETLPYDFLSSNDDSSTLKTNDNFTEEKLSPKTSLYQQSLSPVKRLLNESIDSNIEIIQMDEQECIFEIVDGILTIVPKDKSMMPSTSPLHDQAKRSSSLASSTSTPSLSEQERDDESPPLLIKPLSPTTHQTDQSIDILDLFSAPLTSINPTMKISKTLLDDSLSSVSSYDEHSTEKNKQDQTSIPRSSSPINHQTKSSPIKATSSPSVENQTLSNKNTLLTQLLQTVKKVPADNESETVKPKSELIKPSSSTLPTPKPINKDRINEFASLLSSSVHLSQPQSTKKPLPTTQKTRSSPSRSEEISFSTVPSTNTERESFYTVQSNHSEVEQPKKHIDARYNEKLDDRGSIQIKTANIKALFEQKISDTYKALSQSNEHLTHLSEIRQQTNQHKKVPISYGSLRKNLPNYQQQILPNNSLRRRSYQEAFNMNKYMEHIPGNKDVVIEEKQTENDHVNNTRRQTIEAIVRSNNESSTENTNGNLSESLIAREIRETKEKEDELRRQRKKCGLPEDGSILNDSIKSESSQSVRNSSFLSNLDFFTSKLNNSSNELLTSINPSSNSPSRRSVNPLPMNSSSDNLNSSCRSSIDELKQMSNVVSQELNRFNENGVPIIRTSSTNGLLHRSTSNQNIVSTINSSNIIQREIEAIRAKEVELRQLGRIQHTSDEHADPRKYQELVPTLSKSQSIQTLPTGKLRRDSDNQQIFRQNGLPKSKQTNQSSITSVRGKFPSPNPIAPIVSSTNQTIDYSKLSTTDRLELEKRQCQEREQELRKQRNSISASISSTNTTINGDSGNVSQEEHDDDQEHYFEKIERLKRTENEKAHAPLIRPTKKLDMSQKWEQMMANKMDD